MSAYDPKRTRANERPLRRYGKFLWPRTYCRLGRWLAGRASCSFPELGRCMCQIKSVIARPVLFVVLKAFDRLFHARPMPGWHPPHHEIRALEMLKPFGAAPIETLMDRLIDEMLQRLDILPHRQIDSDAWIGVGPRAGGIATIVDEAPNESRRTLCQAIYQHEVVGEVSHARIIDLITDAADVQLREISVRWLLHGGTPCGLAPVAFLATFVLELG